MKKQKAALTMPFEILVVIIILIVFVVAAILLLIYLQKGSLSSLNFLDPLTFFQNIFSK